VLFRSRIPSARLLVAMTCIPFTPSPYELVPVFLIVSSWWEASVLVLLTYVVALAVPFHLPFPERMLASADAIIQLIIAPCTALVLWRGLCIVQGRDRPDLGAGALARILLRPAHRLDQPCESVFSVDTDARPE